MPLEDRENVDCAVSDAVDDPVRPEKHLSHVLALDFGNDATGERGLRR